MAACNSNHTGDDDPSNPLNNTKPKHTHPPKPPNLESHVYLTKLNKINLAAKVLDAGDFGQDECYVFYVFSQEGQPAVSENDLDKISYRR